MSRYLHGIHDPGGENLMAERPGWITFSLALTEQDSMDFTPYTSRGFSAIGRLNWAHNGRDGTIPEPNRYGEYASRCGEFVKASPGCNIWIIGNEPNHIDERPNGVPIAPEQYAACFNAAREAIKRVQPNAVVLMAAVAPWNPQSGDWLAYFKRMADLCECDGFALHAYTHGSDPALIFSEDRNGGWRWHFRVYRDMLESVPGDKRRLPVWITEADQGDNAWVDEDRGWVSNLYQEIYFWNETPYTQKIMGATIYRWQEHDRWAFGKKDGVKRDFARAVSQGYLSPYNGYSGPAKPPVVSPEKPKEEDKPMEWDERLTQRGVTVQLPQVQPGQVYWGVKSVRWLDIQQSGGRHHIYVNAYDEKGNRLLGTKFLVKWADKQVPIVADKPEEFSGNFAMSKSLNEFSVEVNESIPSAVVKGIGMGANGNSGEHTSTIVEFVLKRADKGEEILLPYVPNQDEMLSQPKEATVIASTLNVRSGPGTDFPVLRRLPLNATVTVTAQARADDQAWFRIAEGGWVIGAWLKFPSTKPAEPLPPPVVETDKWQRSRAFVRKWEGGYQNISNDVGNWTGGAVGKGELKGTKYGISAASYPNLDIKNLTMQQADEIYFRDYWVPSGAAEQPWPMCLIVFDTAVLHGTGSARKWLQESRGNAFLFAARRLKVYTKMSNWSFWGKAWTDRVAELFEEMAE